MFPSREAFALRNWQELDTSRPSPADFARLTSHGVQPYRNLRHLRISDDAERRFKPKIHFVPLTCWKASEGRKTYRPELSDKNFKPRTTHNSVKGDLMTQTTTPFDSTHQSKNAPSSSHRDIASLQEQIRQRAYELYEKRGRHDGHHEEDWSQAEQEVFGQYGLKKAA